jgi:hypothetical protein
VRVTARALAHALDLEHVFWVYTVTVTGCLKNQSLAQVCRGAACAGGKPYSRARHSCVAQAFAHALDLQEWRGMSRDTDDRSLQE